jgi:hypothetical protein
MSDLSLVLDMGTVASSIKEAEAFDDALKTTARKLASQAHLHVIEQVQTRLHTRRQQYLEALVKPMEVEPGMWVITLDAKAAWIEEGMPQHSMVQDLLRKSPRGNSKSGPKIAADGSTYRVIPFERNKGPTRQTAAEQTLTATLKSELKKFGIPWSQIERHHDGSPRTGLLHEFKDDMPKDVKRPDFAYPTPNKGKIAGKPPNDHGFGRGQVGEPMQGPSGVPFLRGLRIYQTPTYEKGPDGKERPKLDKKGQGMAERSIVTFRIVSSKHMGQKWEYPGIEGTHFFDDAYRWIQNEWDQKVLPDLLRQFNMQGGHLTS